MPRSVLRVGTRGSALALARAETIRQRIATVITHRNFELVPVMPSDDDQTEAGGGTTRALVRQIEEALALGKIDLAVHAGPDLGASTREGVTVAAVAGRDDPRAALVTRSGAGLASLSPGQALGVTALGEAAQVRAWQRGLVPAIVEGNLDDRLRGLADGPVGAMLAPLGALRRLDRADRAAEVLPINAMLPVPARGAIVVQSRTNDKLMRPAVTELDDANARAAFEAERSFALSIDARSRVPVAALAEADGDRVRLRAVVAAEDGSRVVQDQIEGGDPEKVGILLAERLRDAGADEIIAPIIAPAG